MGQVKVGIAEGWSAPLDFKLYNDGAAQNLTSTTVTGQAFNRLKQPVVLTSDVSILSATEGTVRLTPDTGDFIESGSPYELRFKVTDGTGAIAFFPSDEPVLLVVRR